MLWVLMALLRECAPAVCYWVVPVRREPRREEDRSANYLEDGCRGPECDGAECYVESLENQNYAEEKRSSSLIALDVRPVSEGRGGRSIHSKRSYIFH